MLTRNLLLFRITKGRLRPSFIRRDDEALLSLATSLLAEVQSTLERGGTRDEVEDTLALHAGAFARPRQARGLRLSRCSMRAML